MSSRATILEPILARQGFVMLDGGLATELEARGHDLRDYLWSARLLADDPHAIFAVHWDYLLAGADIIISAGYQASVPGFMRRGLSESAAEGLLRLSVELALRARDAFWANPELRTGRERPLVAAGVGPYGAFLADGSEYHGNYGLSEGELLAFHRDRWRMLATCGADLLACETIPSAIEVQVLAQLARQTDAPPAWVSLSCRDDGHINDGTPIEQAVAPLLDVQQVAAIGVNCTAPRHLPGLLSKLRDLTDKPLVAYPNSGERYDPETGCWIGMSTPVAFGEAAVSWYQCGARLIGGCCRTGPAHVRRMRRALSRHLHRIPE